MIQPFTEGKAVVQLVLPPSWVTRLNQLALERGLNRSALIRAAIQATYFEHQPVEEEYDTGSPSNTRGIGDFHIQCVGKKERGQ